MALVPTIILLTSSIGSLDALRHGREKFAKNPSVVDWEPSQEEMDGVHSIRPNMSWAEACEDAATRLPVPAERIHVNNYNFHSLVPTFVTREVKINRDNENGSTSHALSPSFSSSSTYSTNKYSNYDSNIGTNVYNSPNEKIYQSTYIPPEHFTKPPPTGVPVYMPAVIKAYNDMTPETREIFDKIVVKYSNKLRSAKPFPNNYRTIVDEYNFNCLDRRMKPTSTNIASTIRLFDGTVFYYNVVIIEDVDYEWRRSKLVNDPCWSTNKAAGFYNSFSRYPDLYDGSCKYPEVVKLISENSARNARNVRESKIVEESKVVEESPTIVARIDSNQEDDDTSKERSRWASKLKKLTKGKF